MPRRKKLRRRIKPIREGHLKDLVQWFLRPLDALRPTRIGRDAWRAALFHLDTRFITQYRAASDFEIPEHAFLRHQQDRLQFHGIRNVRKGTPLWVRVDTTRPDAIDVEVCNGQGKKEQWFQLTREQFAKIETFINEVV